MKIALPFENNSIFNCFEQATSFKIYEIENDKIVAMRFLPVFDFQNMEIDTLLCADISEESKKALERKSVAVHQGYEGNADLAVRSFLAR